MGSQCIKVNFIHQYNNSNARLYAGSNCKHIQRADDAIPDREQHTLLKVESTDRKMFLVVQHSRRTVATEWKNIR